MKITKTLIGLLLFITFASCSDDDSITDNNQELKSYELVEMKWKLKATDGQSIIENRIPEFSFQNNSDTIMEIVIEPLKNLEGSSIFKFEDSLTFSEINYQANMVSIPKELSILSEEYSNLTGGIKVPFNDEKSSFPFSRNIKNSTDLESKSTLISNYTVFLRENRASFLASFREKSTGKTLRLRGTWIGLFFNNLESETVVNDID